MRDGITKSEITFWLSIITVVVAAIIAFFDLKVDVVKTQEKVFTIQEDVAEIKSMMRAEKGLAQHDQ